MSESGQNSGDEKAVALYRGEVDQHALARYAESRVVRALATRIKALDNRKTPLNEMEALLTAQAALATGHNPFPPNPELWSWVKEKDGRRVLTIMRARDGSLKVAKANMRHEGTYMPPPRFRAIVDEAERSRRNIPEGALAWEASITDYRSQQAYLQLYNAMKDAGAKHEQIIAEIGSIPVDIGLGILTADEIENLEWAHAKGQRSFRLEVKFSHEERCKKRALISALRVRWLAQEESPERIASLDTDDYIVEGEWREVLIEDIEDLAPCPACGEKIDRSHDTCPKCGARGLRYARGKAASEALYGTPEETRQAPVTPEPQEGKPTPADQSGKKPGRQLEPREKPTYWPKSVLLAIVDAGYSESEFAAASILARSPFKAGVAKKPALAFLKVYRRARDNKKSVDAAITQALAEWREEMKKDDVG